MAAAPRFAVHTHTGQRQGRLSLSTDGDKCAMDNFFLGGGSIKSSILSFNIQKCDFCTNLII